MELLNLMMKYYIRTGERSFKYVIKNWPVMFALVVYSVIMMLAGIIGSRAYIIGGFIIAIVGAACSGSYLYIIQNVINSRVVTMDDFKYSFTAYLRRVMNTAFYLWIASLVFGLLTQALYRSPYGWIFTMVVYGVVFILLNPLPEFIYQTYHSELSLFRACYEFMKDNFWEWAIPNIIMLGILYYTSGSGFVPFLRFDVIGMIKYLAGLFVFFYTMVYRGILFRFLNESTRRSRLFKLRMLL